MFYSLLESKNHFVQLLLVKRSSRQFKMAYFKALCVLLSIMIGPLKTFDYPNDELCGLFKQRSTSRIYAGQDVVSGELPWVVFLQFYVGNGNATICTGGILNDRWVITAGHCFDK